MPFNFVVFCALVYMYHVAQEKKIVSIKEQGFQYFLKLKKLFEKVICSSDSYPR